VEIVRTDATVARVLTHIHVVILIVDLEVQVVLQLIKVNELILLQLQLPLFDELSPSCFHFHFHLAFDLTLHLHSLLSNREVSNILLYSVFFIIRLIHSLFFLSLVDFYLPLCWRLLVLLVR